MADSKDNPDWEAKYQTLSNALSREKKARKLAEKLLEDKARDLYFSNNELKESLESLKQAQSQLVQSEKMASVGVLAAGVAHEINNPIAYVSSNLETLAEYVDDIKELLSLVAAIDNEANPSDDGSNDVNSIKALTEVYQKNDFDFVARDIQKIIDASIDGTRKVRKIVGDLSEFSALNTPETADVDINELLEKTLNLAWNEIKYDIQLVKDFQPVPTITARSGKLGQVFLNLIINAAHAMEANAPDNNRVLTIKTRASDQKIFVWIQDSGHGIPGDKLAGVFDPFFTTKPVGKGTGLGLHISQNIIDNHNGRLRVAETSPSGTTFEVCLPQGTA